MIKLIRCPGCGRRATLPNVVCRRCRDALPSAVKDGIAKAMQHPELRPSVIAQVLEAVAVYATESRPGPRPA